MTMLVVVEFNDDEEGRILIDAVTGGSVAALDAVLQFGTGRVRGHYPTFTALAKASAYLARDEE